MSADLERRIVARVDALPKGLREHIGRVQCVALELARHHGLDEETVMLGALAHDVARAMSGDQLLIKAGELGIPVHPVEAKVPILLHGPVAAESLRRSDGLQDQDVYEAVYWHSTAHVDLRPAAKVVFLADKLDPQKAPRYPYQPELKELSLVDLDRAIASFLDHELIALLQRGSLVHPVSVEARNQIVLGAS